MFQGFLDMAQSLAAAYVFALPVGIERGRAARKAGMRTFPLVSLGVCAYVLIGDRVLGEDAQAASRVIQGVLTGIGFVGGGAILKTRGTVRGLGTAASIWNTGAIGLSCAYDRYPLALLLALVNLATLHLVHPAHQQEPPQRD
jgi:putative Mg2+ transporter-C (MgtC) family protein